MKPSFIAELEGQPARGFEKKLREPSVVFRQTKVYKPASYIEVKDNNLTHIPKKPSSQSAER